MFMKEIKYTDFNGVDREEKFYFHLSLPEVTRIEAEAGESLKDHIENLITNNKVKELLDFLEHVILTSYGEKTSDGRSFTKNAQLREEFSNSPAYAEFFEQLLTSEGLAQRFGEQVADNGQRAKNTVTPTVIQN